MSLDCKTLKSNVINFQLVIVIFSVKTPNVPREVTAVSREVTAVPREVTAVSESLLLKHRTQKQKHLCV